MEDPASETQILDFIEILTMDKVQKTAFTD
jgi:hypothetical protein